MITTMDRDGSREEVLGRLLGFLSRLDEANAYYRLDHTRPESIMVEVMLPGGNRSMISAGPATAEIGSELDIPFPKSAKSGTMP